MNRLLTGIITILALCMLIACSGVSYAQEVGLDALPPDLQEKVENLLSTRWPPVVKDVKLEPEAPVAGEETAITVTTPPTSDESTDYTSAAVVVYSTDGGETWEEIELEEGADDTEWVGTLPAFESGTEVIYGIRAVDSSNNVYVELPCEPEEWPPSDEYMEESCVNKEEYETCVTNLPNNCMFPMSRDDDGDDEDSIAVKDLDFWDYRIGHSEDKHYIDLAVEGKINAGTVSPMDLYAYVMLVLNPDRGEASALKDFIDKGILILYAPNSEIAGGAIPIKPCMIGYAKGKDFAVDESSITCTKKKNHLFIEFEKEMAFDNPSKYLTWVALSAHVTNISPLSGGLGNSSHFTNAKMISRTFTVE